MAKIIVIEGIDCSGKQTQSDLLVNYLRSHNFNVLKLEFPNYKSESSLLVRQYLAGLVGDVSVEEISRYFYYDRADTMKNIELEDYDYIIIDRFVSSNLIHQGVKFDSEKEFKRFCYKQLNYEYNSLYGNSILPIPDLEIFLCMPKDKREELIVKRKNTDIHEQDFEYMEKCYNIANKVCSIVGGKMIDFVNHEDGKLKTVYEIQCEIRDLVEEL